MILLYKKALILDVHECRIWSLYTFEKYQIDFKISIQYPTHKF